MITATRQNAVGETQNFFFIYYFTRDKWNYIHTYT